MNKCNVTLWTKRWVARGQVEKRLQDTLWCARPHYSEQWCQIIALACEPSETHAIVLNVDGMTGIQMLERVARDLPISEDGLVAREFEYQRHGT
jgi:hypothetical protein